MDAHLDAEATRTTTTRTTPTSQLLAPQTVMMHLNAGEERPVVPLVLQRISIVKLHIPLLVLYRCGMYGVHEDGECTAAKCRTGSAN